jgi:hypothetical protein
MSGFLKERTNREFALSAKALTGTNQERKGRNYYFITHIITKSYIDL